MKDVYEVLRTKELDRSRLKREVEALRVVAPLLSENGEAGYDSRPSNSSSSTAWPQPVQGTKA